MEENKVVDLDYLKVLNIVWRDNVKKWWNNFKEDLMFNITMTIISAMFLILMVLLFIFCFKTLIIEIF